MEGFTRARENDDGENDREDSAIENTDLLIDVSTGDEYLKRLTTLAETSIVSWMS